MNDTKLDVWCTGNLWCPVTTTAQLIGRKWHPVIVFELLKAEPLGFNELKRAADGISNKVLSDALEDLEDKELVDREVIDDKPVRVEYSLTEFGNSLEPVIRAMGVWGIEHLHPPEGMEMKPFPEQLAE